MAGIEEKRMEPPAVTPGDAAVINMDQSSRPDEKMALGPEETPAAADEKPKKANSVNQPSIPSRSSSA
jgi:hypothetical protein